MSRSRLHELARHGQSVWIDYLSRELLDTGRLAHAIDEDAVVGVTSNPTIFQRALGTGHAYDAQIEELLATEDDPKALFIALATRDVVNACDLLRSTWDAARGRDGYVSIEVDPTLAHDAPAMIAEAQRLHVLIDRPNLLVKIPATASGLIATEALIARGRSINVTLIFSPARHAQVAERYLRGLERLIADGGDPGGVVSVASFFVSRIDTEADRRLDALGGQEALRGRLAIAAARVAYQGYRRAFAGERWAALSARGAMPQRCLWASTSTKDPAHRDVRYVEELIGPETVSTMPEETLRAFQDHGRVEPTLERGVPEAGRLLERARQVGVDVDEVARALEEDGIERFIGSFDALLRDLATRRSPAAVGGGPREERLPDH